MKNIIKLTGLFVLIFFSFFYSDRVLNVISSKDLLMIKIRNVSNSYNVSSIDGIILNDSIIPGVYGKKVNVDRSYKKMREYGVFNENMLFYDYIKPNISIDDNMDKFIIKGNSNKKMVSIVFILDNNRYIDKLDSVILNKDVVVNYFVNSNYLMSNSNYVSSVSDNVEVYNYGDDGIYSPDNLIFFNNLITRITKREAKYCLSIDKDINVSSLCSKNNLYTLSPNVIIYNNLYSSVKNDLDNGNIYLIDLNNNNVIELPIIIDYIRKKGFVICGLSDLLSEK